MTEVLVTVADLRAAKICPDAKMWFEENGLDWKDFVLNGAKESVILNALDQTPLVERVLACARCRSAKGDT